MNTKLLDRTLVDARLTHLSPNQLYLDALRKCTRIAREEHRNAGESLAEVEILLRNLSKRVEDLAASHTQQGAALADTQQTILGLGSGLLDILDKGLVSSRRALDQKGLRLDSFTVTLFGRTMAGKSTIREALTGGDGSSIGKGAQRTTRDVIEYQWESLRLIDTPGIGAYEGGVDRDLALSILDESDLVLFLISSDGIQEEAFKGMQALRERNKPAIFILNVKEDLERPVLRKRFLREPAAMFTENAIGGHLHRVQTLAKDWLGMNRVTIIPIHAQAAFLAGRVDNQEESEALRKASRIDALLDTLREEVRHRGTVRRLQTITDGTVNDIQDIQAELQTQSGLVRKSAALLKSKFSELDIWLDSYIKSTNLGIEQAVSQKLHSLRQEVSAFVDDNIELEDFPERWQKKISARHLPQWAESQQKAVFEEVVTRLAEFNRETQAEATFGFNFNAEAASSYDPFNVKRTLGWTAAVGSVVSGGAFAVVFLEIGAANIWNPVGWIALGAGLLAGIFAWLSDSREEKIQRQKAKAADQLRSQVDRLERRLTAAIKSWFYDEITSKLAKGIRQDTRALIEELFHLARLLKSESDTVGSLVERLNRRLLTRICEFRKIRIPKDSIGHIVRDPGNRTKFIWLDPPIPGFVREVGQSLGEWVDAIPSGSVESMAAYALRPAQVTSCPCGERA